jgi:hypothetical protein
MAELKGRIVYLDIHVLKEDFTVGYLPNATMYIDMNEYYTHD